MIVLKLKSSLRLRLSTYDLQMKIVSTKKTAALMIIRDPAARALFLFSFPEMNVASCHSSITSAPAVTNMTHPTTAMIPANFLSISEFMTLPGNWICG